MPLPEPEVGRLIEDRDRAERDAIHVAIYPCIAGVVLKPGQRVSLDADGRAIPGRASAFLDRGGAIGIVDPYLTAPVDQGERFWLFLMPRSTTSLRHNWSHPAIPDRHPDLSVFHADHETASHAASEQYIRDWASKHGISYDLLLDSLERGFVYDHDFHEPLPPELWDHYEIVTGCKVPASDRLDWMGCSC